MFYIEQKLKEQCNIPVMHDDQHGTAIISSAALLNALEIQRKRLTRYVLWSTEPCRCHGLYQTIRKTWCQTGEFYGFDINGILHKGRTDIKN